MAENSKNEGKVDAPKVDAPKADAPKADAPKAAAVMPQPTNSEELTFPVTALIARSIEYLGVASYIAAGALYGYQGDITIEAAQEQINTWLSAPVGDDSEDSEDDTPEGEEA